MNYNQQIFHQVWFLFWKFDNLTNYNNCVLVFTNPVLSVDFMAFYHYVFDMWSLLNHRWWDGKASHKLYIYSLRSCLGAPSMKMCNHHYHKTLNKSINSGQCQTEPGKRPTMQQSLQLLFESHVILWNIQLTFLKCHFCLLCLFPSSHYLLPNHAGGRRGAGAASSCYWVSDRLPVNQREDTWKHTTVGRCRKLQPRGENSPQESHRTVLSNTSLSLALDVCHLQLSLSWFAGF